MLKYFLFIFISVISFALQAQNITVNNNYTPQELIEDILIDSGCIENINVTNTVSGNFGANDSSFGYFESNS